MKRLLLLFSLLALPAHGLDLTLVTNNISIPVGTTFQMPLAASEPVTFKVDSISWRAVKGVIAPATNRSLVLNVTGLDSNNAVAFTGDIVLQLAEDLVPRTTARIIDLVSSNLYDGAIFHRISPNKFAQAGITNNADTGTTIDDEYERTLIFNGFGQLGLAKTSLSDSGDAQFFITAGDLSVANPQKPSPRAYDFRYPLFGQVTRGFDVLRQLIATPVIGDTPISSNIINSATILTDATAGVLRLTALPGFVGDVTVVVSAMNAQHATARQTLLVKVVANTQNDPPYLGPIPSSFIITQAMAASFILTTTDVEDDKISLDLVDQDTGAFPTNMQAGLDSVTSRLWLKPDLTFTGTLHLVLGVTDSQHPFTFDRQQFDLIVAEKSATPTLSILPKSGSLLVSPDPLGSRIKLAGTLGFTNTSDHAFGSNDYIIVTVGGFTMTVPPDAHGRSTKGGVIRMKSIPGAIPTMAATFDSGKGTFKLALSNFNFPSPQTNPVIQVSFTLGNDYGSNVTTWTQSKPGAFIFPK
ncbi:MAG: peptidylprolyl isomerase [Verrucomicrobiota bacterium]